MYGRHLVTPLPNFISNNRFALSAAFKANGNKTGACDLRRHLSLHRNLKIGILSSAYFLNNDKERMRLIQ